MISTDCPVEAGATVRILGMFSKDPGSAGGAASCSVICWSLCFGAEAMI